MLHQKSIHQLKLLQALQKKRIKNARNIAVEQYDPVIVESTSEQEPNLDIESEPVQIEEAKSLPIQVITPNEPIMNVTIATPLKKSPPSEMYQKISIPIEIEQSECRKLFEEYEQYKYEQNIWNKLHGK